MYFETLNAALEMAGHGVFVWSAYGIAFAVLAGFVIQPIVKHRNQRKHLQAQSRAAQLLAEKSDS